MVQGEALLATMGGDDIVLYVVAFTLKVRCDPLSDMRDGPSREAVLGVVESKVERGRAFRQLALILQVLLAREPLIVRGSDMQHMGARRTVTGILMPVARHAAAHADRSANLVRIGENVAVVVGAGLRKGQQKDARGIGSMLPDRQPDQLADGFMMETDGFLHFVAGAPAEHYPIGLGVRKIVRAVANEKLILALKGDHHHAVTGNPPGNAHHGILIALIAVQRNQQGMASSAGRPGKVDFVVAPNRTVEGAFHTRM